MELGCGTGKNTVWLLKKAQRIIGLDFSQEMLNIAKEKITVFLTKSQKPKARSQKPIANS
ncbi:class I SAM-dependent methyltransferase [Maribacter sp. TH_r10]|uniref:class I SAM-dependent methyltransferase n=1 Tax=Maribacter sp. TH_r10 TaxID=3082086 RepID=UPI002954D396|nr:class I SAM-dependent methyltransferase [Maribacter sp. TH_r10]MDV7140436.1 class I SAM-dependent methyltransferase [Maribacter sp. TH_r10]